MPTTKPFAYNTGSTISNTQQVGSLAIATGGTIGGNVTWWMGPDEDLGFVITVPVSGGTQPTPVGSNAFLGFYRSQNLTNSSFLDLAEYLYGGTFSSYTQAQQWVVSQGYYTSYEQLEVYFDGPANSTFYLPDPGQLYSYGRNNSGNLGIGLNPNTEPNIYGVNSVVGGLSFCKIGTHSETVCGINNTNTLYCWGSGSFGKLGNNSTTDVSTPVAVCGGLQFSEVIPGQSFVLGLTTQGVLYSWGFNFSGELGLNDTTSRRTPVQVCGGLTFSQVSAGVSHSCGLSNTGISFCWGSAEFGKLGDNNSITNRCTPTAVCGGLTFTKIVAGSSHTCAVTQTGIPYCWGQAVNCGINDAINNKSTPVAVCGNFTFTDIHTIGDATFGITSNGIVYSWGVQSSGELGINVRQTSQLTPVAICGGLSFSKITGRGQRTLGMTLDNRFFGWGQNNYFQIQNNSTTPQSISTTLTFVQVSGGDKFSCGRNNLNRVFCWGTQDLGVLGNNTDIVDDQTPVQVCGTLTFTNISCGTRHTLATATTNVTYAWGYNFLRGCLGNNTTNGASTPVAVCGGLSFTQIVAANDYSLGLTSTGLGYGWGSNGNGELGINNGGSNVCTPVAIVGGLTFSRIAGKFTTSYGITNTGAAYSWGAGSFGGLGNNTLTVAQPSPVAVCGNLTFSEISCGNYFAVGMTNTGLLYSWGYNNFGQLGINSTVSQLTPVAVCGGLTFSRVSCGASHVIGLTTNGSLYAWGLNEQGQLGDNTTIDKSTPVAVCVGLTFTSINCGTYNSSAVTSGGVVYTWGKNTNGETGRSAWILTPISICNIV